MTVGDFRECNRFTVIFPNISENLFHPFILDAGVGMADEPERGFLLLENVEHVRREKYVVF